MEVDLFSVTPKSALYESYEREINESSLYILSRFVYMRRDNNKIVIESPLSGATVFVTDWRSISIIYWLMQPISVRRVLSAFNLIREDQLIAFFKVLLSNRMICESNSLGASMEDQDASLRNWEFHDLLFHVRSRLGGHRKPVGSANTFLKEEDAPPALEMRCYEHVIDLFQPNLDALEKSDPPYAWVQEARRSIRQYGSKPIRLEQLAEFLFRIGRVADFTVSNVLADDDHRIVRIEYALRPYPSGGALYELELYVVARACEGLPSGLYYYDPARHRLGMIAVLTMEVTRLIADAASAAGIRGDDVQVLSIVASRFRRLAWKYKSIAYALTLKHVGVLYHSMYLAATAMGLAPCALGAGDSVLFAQATGLDRYAETSVGEFLLGSKDIE